MLTLEIDTDKKVTISAKEDGYVIETWLLSSKTDQWKGIGSTGKHPTQTGAMLAALNFAKKWVENSADRYWAG